MNSTLGARTWVIPEGYIPGESASDDRAMRSHETACILNAGDDAAIIQITIYFADRDPLGPYEVRVEARRTKHIRFNDLADPAVPRDHDFSSVIRASEPVIVQHTRLDSRQPPHALLSTIAWPAP